MHMVLKLQKLTLYLATPTGYNKEILISSELYMLSFIFLLLSKTILLIELQEPTVYHIAKFIFT
jgi:hypothetical protein